MKDIRELELPPLPNRRIQERIASILSAYDDLIENNTRRIKILEEMAQRLYREWFVHFRFPGHENVRMVESELGRIPEGWRPMRLSDLAKINSRSVKASAAPEHINYIDIASVSTGRIDRIERCAFKEAPGRARRIVGHGDTIWSTVRPNRRSYALMVDPEPNLIVSTGFAVLTAIAVPFTYLHLAVTTNEFADYLTNHATGSAYPAATGKEFEKATLLVPDGPLLKRFHEIVEPMLTVFWSGSTTRLCSKPGPNSGFALLLLKLDRLHLNNFTFERPTNLRLQILLLRRTFQSRQSLGIPGFVQLVELSVGQYQPVAPFGASDCTLPGVVRQILALTHYIHQRPAPGFAQCRRRHHHSNRQNSFHGDKDVMPAPRDATLFHSSTSHGEVHPRTFRYLIVPHSLFILAISKREFHYKVWSLCRK
jgi:type I restriction enzyme S subunit